MTVKLLLLLYAVLLCPGEALLGPKEIPSGNKSQKSICGDMGKFLTYQYVSMSIIFFLINQTRLLL